MRILFDPRQAQFKTPFGCVTPSRDCTLRIHIPTAVSPTQVLICLLREDGTPFREIPMRPEAERNHYLLWQGQFQFTETGLYFYYFCITGGSGTFRLFKQGQETNMEAGDLWQLSCIPENFTVPDWARGAVIYQIFPDRFCRSGSCDLTEKLRPFLLHEHWDEEVVWQPTASGDVLNNDFYGGNFKGICEKLDYIASLGTTIIYLNPICKSFSSHRYDTGDYKTPDPMLGTEADFSVLCQTAHQKGIRVILDGVFSHTGANSVYFDREGSFGGHGAYCNPESPYYSWYHFREHPKHYDCWWGFDTLPTVNKLDPGFLRYVITDDHSVVAHWLGLGADGFRLDVADELPGEFLRLLKQRIRDIKPDALLMGEVWEDASNKIAYGKRCRYFTDGVLDSVMNYPFRTGILRFLRREDDGSELADQVMTIAENYPTQVLPCAMNLLSSHDTPRILTALVDDFDGSREQLAKRRLSPEAHKKASALLRIATVIQYTLPGSPSIYYGDEAGMEGGKDPFNRRPYPWGKEDTDLLTHYRQLGQLRKQHPALRLGDISFFRSQGGQLGYTRTLPEEALRIYVNQSDTVWHIPRMQLLLSHRLVPVAPQWQQLAPGGWCIQKEDLWKEKP